MFSIWNYLVMDQMFSVEKKCYTQAKMLPFTIYIENTVRYVLGSEYKVFTWRDLFLLKLNILYF